MALFIGVQHLCTFNIVASLTYHLFPKVWKASYTFSAFIFVQVPHWPPYSTNKFMTCVYRVFHFGQEIVIAWAHIGWVRWMFQNLLSSRAKRSVTAAAAWLLALSWRIMRFCTTKCRRFFLSPCDYDLFGQVTEPLRGTRYYRRAHVTLYPKF